jgi:hypothetical protein
MKSDKMIVVEILLLMILMSLSAVGCGPKIPPPHDRISNAEMAIERARQENASVYAPLDLKLAEEKLENAKKAMSVNNYSTAARLAEESLLDAQTAEVRSKAEKAKELSQKMQESVDSLRKELERTK